MKRTIVYWGATGSGGDRGAAWRVQLCDQLTRGDRELPARGVSAAATCLARHREAGGRHRAAAATAADVEGMGLRRLYLHVDRGNRRALSGGRREIVVAGRVARAAGGFVRDAPGESPRFREVDAGAGRRLDPASGVRAIRRLRQWRRRSSCPMGSRERRVVRNARSPRETPERVGFERVAGSTL